MTEGYIIDKIDKLENRIIELEREMVRLDVAPIITDINFDSFTNVLSITTKDGYNTTCYISPNVEDNSKFILITGLSNGEVSLSDLPRYFQHIDYKIYDYDTHQKIIEVSNKYNLKYTDYTV